MAKRANGLEIRAAQPLRTVAQWGLFLLCLAGAVTLMVIGRTDPEVFERARMQVTDAVAPILTTISQPVVAANNMVAEVEALTALREDNQRLRLEVARLQQWQAVARHLEAENAEMRALLGYSRRDVDRYITGRVIGVGGTFVRALLLSVGERDGVRKGQVAVTGDGLIGRIAETGNRSSRVLLVTDLNSRVPVKIEGSSARAILAGDNTAFPRLIYGAANSDLSAGQRVVTSGDAGAFPPGIPVGIVLETNDDTGVRVQIFADEERPELVRLMDFGLDGILDSKEAEGDIGLQVAVP